MMKNISFTKASKEKKKKRMHSLRSAFNRRVVVPFPRVFGAVSPRRRNLSCDLKPSSLSRARPSPSDEAFGAREKMGGDHDDGNGGVGGVEKKNDENPDLLDSLRSFEGFVVDEVLSVNDLTKAAAVVGR